MALRGLNGGTSMMRFSLALALFLALSPAAFAQQNATKRTDDAANAAFKQLVDTYTEAWGRNDAHALAMLYTEDCDYVVVNGAISQGRDAVETLLAKNFSTNLKNSTRTDSIRRVRFLTPDIVSLDDYWVITEPADAVQPRREGYYNWILLRQDGRWLIAIQHAAAFPAARPAPEK